MGINFFNIWKRQENYFRRKKLDNLDFLGKEKEKFVKISENKGNLRKLESDEIIGITKLLRKSCFKSSVPYTNITKVVEKMGFKLLENNIDSFSAKEFKEIFTNLGYLTIASLWKSQEFKDYVQKNNVMGMDCSDLEYEINGNVKSESILLPLTLSEWHKYVDSLDQGILRQIGRLYFYDFLNQDNKVKYFSQINSKSISIVDKDIEEIIPVIVKDSFYEDLDNKDRDSFWQIHKNIIKKYGPLWAKDNLEDYPV